MNDNELNYQMFGCHHTALGRVLKGHKSAGLDDPSMDHPSSPIEPVKHVIEGARSFNQAKGLDDPHAGIDYSKVRTNRDLLKDLATHYDKLPTFDRSALPHFHAMRDETNQQYHHMTHNMGINVEVTDHDPYKDVHELADDVRNNKRIKVLGTHATGGHPLFSNEDNDKFRAVHDVFGHLGTGRDFDRHGEEAAFQAHARMFSHHARPALTSETRGQNGSLIVNGKFGPQRIAVLPNHLWHPGLAAHESNLSNEDHLTQGQVMGRVAILVRTNDPWIAHDIPQVLPESAWAKPWNFREGHISGNSVDVLHCPFCGSGALVARSDGTIECDYDQTVFTVQVQPAYNAFPQSVDGAPYDWPGQPDPNSVVAPGTTEDPGLGMGMPGDDPMAQDGSEDDIDPTDDGSGDDDSSDNAPPWAKGSDDDSKSKSKAELKPKSKDKSKDKKDDKKGKNPFDKKSSSFKTESGYELDEDKYIAHLAIKFAQDKFRMAAKIKESW